MSIMFNERNAQFRTEGVQTHSPSNARRAQECAHRCRSQVTTKSVTKRRGYCTRIAGITGSGIISTSEQKGVSYVVRNVHNGQSLPVIIPSKNTVSTKKKHLQKYQKISTIKCDKHSTNEIGAQGIFVMFFHRL
jgi:hypothetical protein